MKPASPRPWTVERTNAGGWKGIAIKDASGLFIARMVMQPGADNEMENAKAIVAAVNASHQMMLLPEEFGKDVERPGGGNTVV